MLQFYAQREKTWLIVDKIVYWQAFNNSIKN